MTETPPVMRLVKRILLALSAALPIALPAAAQSPPPDADWRTFSTEHFRVTFPPELEPLARHAADVAERTYVVLRDELGKPPSGVIDMVVTDHVDFTNGYATFFPSSRITVYARPPAGVPQLAYVRDWLELVVAHELVHIFHLDEAGRVGNAIRTVFGQVPMVWPLFPVAGSPTWNVEGLATYYESRLTGAGRVHGSFQHMMARTAALEDRIPSLDRLSAPHPAWPGGQRSYAYGSLLMDYIAGLHGPDAHRDIVEATGGSVLPTFLFFDHVSRKAVGEPFDVLFEQWRAETTDSALALAERLRGDGLTPTERVAGEGPFAATPRVSPDGTLLSYGAHDFRSEPGTRIVDLATGRERVLARRNQFGIMLGPAAWLPDGDGVVVAQLERKGPYRIFSDLWRVDLRGGEHRLTRGERIDQPDVASDGRRVAAVRNRAGGLELVVYDLETGEIRVLAPARAGEAFDAPRWSPDGARIATGRFAAGRNDVVVVDAATGAITPLTDDDAVDRTPAWSPDGEWVLWESDRTGIPNILAARSPAPAPDGGDGAGDGVEGTGAPGVVWQVTNVLTGAFDPEVSPDGATLYLSVYHHDGWRIEKTAFDASSWQRAPESVMAYRPGVLAWARPEAESPGDGAPSRTYDPWATLRPTFWLPEVGTLNGPGGSLLFLGGYSASWDVTQRHEWELSAAVDPRTWRARGYASWVYRGLGVPDVRLAVSRDWSRAGTVDVDDGLEAIYRRTDAVALDAVFWRARWRANSWLRVGAEIEAPELQGHDLSDEELDAQLAARDLRLVQPPTVVGVSAGPGYSNARVHPFSVSAESGISGSLSAGRWWDISSGAHAYDEFLGRLSGYLDFPLWGFADHVLAVRTAGLFRDGDRAGASSIGGVPGGNGGIPTLAGEVMRFVSGSFLPARGFDNGVRAGSRAWSASGEWRFPLHMRARHHHVLGLSLTSISGALFADAANAWCPEGSEIQGCTRPGRAPLLSAGGELSLDFGIFHNSRALIRFGVAQPIQGPGDGRPSWYVSAGPSF